MQRILLSKFREWLHSPRRKSLILRGARQVGKTWFVRDAAEQLGYELVEINFEETPEMSRCFSGNLAPHKVVENIEVALNRSISNKTILFFDEVQSCKEAYVSLKFFTDRMSELPVVAAGSHLRILEQMEDVSHPVGYVDDMTLFPMNLEEFILATNPHNALIEQLDKKKPASAEMHDRLLSLYQDYLYVGGLPECVKLWCSNATLLNRIQAVRDAQLKLLNLYKSDFSKYHGRDALGLVATWEAIARQLHLSVNTGTARFKFKGVLSGKKEFSQFRNHFQRLEASGLIHCCPVVDQGSYPLKVHMKDSLFKAFFFDTGILLCELDYSYQALNSLNEISYKGFLTENYVAIQLKQNVRDLFSYSTKSSEIEFLLQMETSVLPIEVKNNNLRAKSLASFISKNNTSKAIKLSNHPYFKDGIVENLPLYQTVLAVDPRE